MFETDFVEEINSKYAAIENELDQKLKKLNMEEERENLAYGKQEKAYRQLQKTFPTLEEARKRNSELIKSLEMSKARLRSRSTYSPIESILEKALKNYSKALYDAKSEGM
ncbi:unnamed protein product [Hermetia illucens]|uniref:Uncharacterized protein n=1 Tax=Hermetia illucens TaxID=343691 RepID=A0A7R8V707_HERIL|nr:uncharacterized protein LOC119660110 [Hermetia illucens]CAD7093262.1 unnamed protein product [Hermetia illucens]